jgi:hypothetical protein
MNNVSNILAEIKVNVMDYCDWICWLWYQKNIEGVENMNLIQLTDYVKFYNSDDEDAEMTTLEWVDVDSIYAGAIKGIDVMNESSFISASCDETEERLIVRLKDKMNKAYAFYLEIA